MSRPKGSKGGSSSVNNREREISSAIVRPRKRSNNAVHPLDENQLPEQEGASITLNLEEELARLELETLDDFVYNALGSFHIGSDGTGLDQGASSQVSRRSNNNKYKVGSPTDLSAEGQGNEVGRTLEEVLSSDKTPKPSYRDSGISSGTADHPTSPNVFVIEHSLFSLGSGSESQERDEPGRSLEMETVSVEPKKPKPLKSSNSVVDKKAAHAPPLQQLQPNGSVVGPSSSSASAQAPITSTHKNKLPHSVHSTVGHHSDSNVLRSDLLAAVEQNKVDKVRRILSSGIDANSVCDDKGRWPLHIAALLGHAAIAKLLLEHGAQRDQPDTALERTPLLYAAANSPETVKVLLSYRVDIHARNKFGSTALHYSAGAGQAECCRLLAAAGCDVHSRDRQKMTPLHMAARVDDIWTIDVLLEYGADIHAKDGMGKNALHHAAETGEGMESDYAKMGACFKKLIGFGSIVNTIDNDGKTALYYAIQTGSAEAVMILHELGAELTDGISLLNMARKFPNIIPPFLDRCVSSNIDTCDAESKQFYIQFDYTCLTFFPKDIPNDKLLSMQNREETESILREMGTLHGLTRCKDSSILSHPVCESLLRLKWKKVKWYLYLDMLLFAVFLAFLTAVIFMEYESDSPRSPHEPVESENGTIVEQRGSAEEGTHVEEHHERYCMDSTRNIVVWSILWVLTALLGIREMIQLIQAPLHYVVQVENMLELVLVSSVALLSLAECGVKSFVGARDHFAAVCLIVGWTIQVTLYGKIPVFGVYIRMFAAVATNILKCMFTYLGLLFAFSLTLHFLFRTQKDFDSVGFTFLKTFAMMIGEIDLARTFIDNGRNSVIVPFTSHLVVALFIIFISIILSSLFLALAVCDISSMQREGEYMQLVQQVKVASQLEDALQQRSLLYPQFGMRDMRSLHQRKGVIFPNLKDHGKLSKDALEIVMTQHTRKRGSAHNEIAPPIDHTSSMMKATNDVAEDLIVKLKTKMDKYALEVDKKSSQMFVDMKGTQDRGSSHLTREVLLIKSQLEDMNICLREMSNTIKSLADRTLEDSASPTSMLSEKRRPFRRSQTTGRFDETSGMAEVHPDVEGIQTSTSSTPDNRDSQGPSRGSIWTEEASTSESKSTHTIAESKTQESKKPH